MKISYPQAIRFIRQEHGVEEHDLDFDVIETIEGAEHRWDREMRTVIHNPADDTYWGIDWRKGGTEMQPNSFDGLDDMDSINEFNYDRDAEYTEEYGMLELVPLTKHEQMVKQVTFTEKKATD